MFRFFSFIVCIFFSVPIFGQEIGNKARVITQYDSLNKAFPKEKLYLHLDKSVYAPIDTIWFKAYLIEPSQNTASSLSGLIYIDVVNANGSVVQSLSLPTKLGISWGSLVLNPKAYKSGIYTLRGYTNWMQNFGDTYFFKKQIKIVAIPANFSTPKSAPALTNNTNKANIPAIQNIQNPSVQFLPEGGSWIVGRLQKIAFKAIAPNGKGVAIEGEIKDSKLRQLATFKSNAKGMGYFTAIAEPEEIYTAFIKVGKTNYNQQLPRAKTTGTTLIVRNDYALDSLVISVISDVPNQSLTLIGQSKGQLCFSANFPPDTRRRTIKIAKRIFPTGVSQIILQSQDQILNERNFFINHQDQLQVNLSSPSTTYTSRDSIPLQIKVNDANQQSVSGSFSVAITDDNQVLKNEESDDNILSYFLLSSDLKGEIEDPAHYFKDFNEQKHEDLEALCLTQGWVSYNWDLGKKPKYKLEKEYTISGRITNISNKPIAKAKVSIFGRSKVMVFGDTTTNENGEFVFRNLPPMDSAIFALRVLNSKGKLGTLGFEVNEFKQLPIKTILTPKITSEEPLDNIELNFITSKQQEYKANPANGIGLREVTIVGKKVIKGSKNLNGPGEADQILNEEDLDKIPKKTLYQLLNEKITGFHISTLRKSVNRGLFIKTSPVKIIIDGMDIDYFYTPMPGIDDHYRYVKIYLDTYLAEDILGMEVMTSMRNFGSYDVEFTSDPNVYSDPIRQGDFRSYIEITTKAGVGPFLKKSSNMYLYKPQTYGDLKVFYSPKYTVANKTNKKPDLRSTIYWAPNIVTNTKGEANFSFFSADKKGTYTVWIEGSDMQGKFGKTTMKLVIK